MRSECLMYFEFDSKFQETPVHCLLYLKVWIAILQSTLLTVVLPPAFPATGSFSSVYLHKCVENTFVDLLHHQMSSFPMSTNAGHSF